MFWVLRIVLPEMCALLWCVSRIFQVLHYYFKLHIPYNNFSRFMVMCVLMSLIKIQYLVLTKPIICFRTRHCLINGSVCKIKDKMLLEFFCFELFCSLPK